MRAEKALLRVIDAAYDLEQSAPGSWLTNVLEGSRGFLDQGLGCYAWTIVQSGNRRALGDVATVDFGPEQVAAIDGFHREASPSLWRASYGDVPTAPIILASGLFGGVDAFRRARVVKKWMHRNRMPDCVGLRIQVDATCLVFGAVVREIGCAPEAVVRYGGRFLDVLAPAFRMHHALRSTVPPRVEAVLTPDGRLVDAEGAAKGRTAREVLASAVRADDKRRRDAKRAPDAALQLFEGLVAGRWTLRPSLRT